jgi:hypothetical protein
MASQLAPTFNLCSFHYSLLPSEINIPEIFHSLDLCYIFEKSHCQEEKKVLNRGQQACLFQTDLRLWKTRSLPTTLY